MVEIWVAVIAMLGSLAGTIITVVWGNKKNAERSEKQTEVTIYRIEQLEKKQDKHNSLMERVFKLEKKEAVLENEVQSVREHIDDLHRDDFHG